MSPVLASWGFVVLASLSADASQVTEPGGPPTTTAAAVAAAPSSAPTTEGSPMQLLVMIAMPPDHARIDNNYEGPYGSGAGRVARRHVADDLAQRYGLRVVSAWPIVTLAIDCFVMEVPSSERIDQALELLSAEPHVAWAQTMKRYRTQADNAEYDDPLYRLQPAASLWQLHALHSYATGKRVRVAIIDSGVDVHHPDLEGQIEASVNFVADHPMAAEHHGTEVAGIIAARANNHLGIVGIAPRSRLLALRACWQGVDGVALCSSLTLALALDHAIRQEVEIINMSLSGPDDRLLGRLLDVALHQSRQVVAAADSSQADGGFPASHAGVLPVMAEGPAPTMTGRLSAPGHDIPTTEPAGHWALVSGNSYAAAHVSGLLALVRELERPRGVSSTTNVLAQTARGSVDACATMQRARGQGSAPCVSTASPRTAEHTSWARP